MPASPLVTEPMMDQATALSRPIRVVVVQPALAKYRVPVFRELARRAGIDLTVVYGTRADLPNVPADGFKAVPVPRWEKRIAGSLLMSHSAEWTYCTRQHADVVVLRWSPRSLSLLPGLLRARAQGVGTVLWGHGYSKTERSLWRGARNWFAKQASCLVFYEPRTRDAFIHDGWDPKKLFVALNSIERTEIDEARREWADRPEKLSNFRREHGLDRGPMLLFVSRLQPANRVDLLIRATARLAAEFQGLKTVIIGSGLTEKQRLQSLTADVGATENVIFREGIYDEKELAPWFMSADLFGYPSNIGLSLLHAFSYGLPVVTSDNVAAQNPEIVAFEDGVNGLAYAHDDESSLVETIRRILIDAQLRKTLSQAARDTVEHRFTIANMVDGLAAAIRYASERSTAKGS